jgi:hypothetical protein
MTHLVVRGSPHSCASDISSWRNFLSASRSTPEESEADARSALLPGFAF